MQQEKSTFLDFRRRTDALAARLNVRIGDLPAKLELSRASLFGYRSGKIQISSKAWHKLEQAEREVGLSPSLKQQLETRGSDLEGVLASASLEEILNLIPKQRREKLILELCDAHIDSLEYRLRGFFLDAQALADLVKTKRLRTKDAVFFANKVNVNFKQCTDAYVMLIKELRMAVGLQPQSIADKLRTDKRRRK